MLSLHRLTRAAAVALFVALAGGCAHPPGVERFLVAAAHPLAAEAGYDVLARGGSAVDAAIAVQAMLGLVEPQSSGIGGGAFLLHWSEADKALTSYDGRERAPAAARADRFLDTRGTPQPFLDAVISGRSVGVPGVLRMLELAHRRHGRLPWRELFASAIAAAEEGFRTSPRLRAMLEREAFLRHSVFFDASGSVRSRIVNPQYGATLRLIARDGADAFYRGPIARDIVQAVRAHAQPGDVSEEDLAGYRALEREPICALYRGRRVCSMGPPSSGGIAVLQILGMLESTGFARAPPDSAAAVHIFAEAGKLAFADRARYVGDPDFVGVPVDALLDRAYLEKRARLIGERASPRALPGDTESSGTSHFSIADADGNVVAMTTTVENRFGSRIMVRGFLLNNQLTDFDFVPGGPNEVRPLKRPRSSMAPTLVFAANGRVQAALGSPGGPMIINYVAKTLVAMLDWRLDVQTATEAPNFGSVGRETRLERGTPYEGLRDALERRGHIVEIAPLVSGVHGVERVFGRWRSGVDPRREGAARGH